MYRRTKKYSAQPPTASGQQSSVLTLTPSELRELAGRRRSDAQARVLEHMGVPYTRRPDGSLVVLRVVAERMLGGGGTMVKAEPQLQP